MTSRAPVLCASHLPRVLLGLVLLAACGDEAGTSDSATDSVPDGDTASGAGGTGGSGDVGTSSAVTTSSNGTSGSAGGSTAGSTSTGSTNDVTTGSTDSSTTSTTGGAGSLAVLFVGNSYTAANDLPGLVVGVGTSLGWTFTAQAFTPGGAQFEDHVNNVAVTDAIATGAFDFVSLQGQSVETIHPSLSAAAYTNGIALAGLVADANMEPVFFETWARAAGHADYDNAWTGGDPTAMAALTHDAYLTIATDAGASLAPVGQAWIDVVTNAPTIDLYSGDGSHPSIHGSYLTACVFFAVLTGETPVGASEWPAEISGDEALTLQEAAELAAAP